MTTSTLIEELKSLYVRIGYVDGLRGLKPPASRESLDQAEHLVGFQFPDSVRAIYLMHDGQQGVWPDGGLFGEFGFAGLADSIGLYKMQKEIVLDEEPDIEDFVLFDEGVEYYSKYFITIGACGEFHLCVHARRGSVWTFGPHNGAKQIASDTDHFLRCLIKGAVDAQGPCVLR